MKTAQEMKANNVALIDGQPWLIQKAEFTKSGRNSAIVKMKLRNLINGSKTETVYKADDKMEQVILDRKEVTLSYINGEDYVFMDLETYDQLPISSVAVGDAANYLLPEAEVVVATHDGEPLYVDLPASVVLEVTYPEPGVQGDRATGGTKPATVETGATVQVPLFITTGEKIKVDTRDGRYLGRA